MIWMTWQQHRFQLLIGSVLLVLLTIFLLVTGLTIASYYQNSVVSCVAVPTCTVYLFNRFQDVVGNTLVLYVLFALPILVGVFIGAHLVSREVEHGTYLLAWTQGITRRRWLAAKLGMLIVLTLVAFGFLDGWMLWWTGPVSAGLGPYMMYDVFGLVPLAYALFALGLGIAVGVLVRHQTAAMAITFAIFVGIRVAVEQLRTFFLPTVTDLQPYQILQVHYRDWITKPQDFVDHQGHEVSNHICGSAIQNDFVSCMQSHGVLVSTTYHPASQFWAFQGIESAMFLLLAAASISLALWWVQHRVR
jgi:ABC-type transport system involved in multi-copper enzyme maturation permease subunit